MAIKTYKIKYGDTLSGIAKKFDTTVAKLADWNNIKNVNRIYAGDTIIVSKTGSSGGSGGSGPGSGPGSSSSSTKKKTSSNKAKITNFDLQNDTDRTVFATWTWDKDHTDNYKVMWYYHTGDGVWFVGNDGTEEYKQSTYTAPSNATQVKFKVKPISTKHKVNKKDTSWWTAQWSTEKIYKFKKDTSPVAPGSAPTVEINDLQLTVSLDNLKNLNAKKIEFQIVKNDKTVFKTATVNISTQSASYSCTVSAGAEYKARARSVDGKEYSDWTDYSSNVGTIPATPKDVISIKALSETSVYIDWENVKNAKSYTVEYTTNKTYFDSNPSEVKSVTVESVVGHAEITGMESGHKYFFRVKAVNDKGDSGWSETVSIIIGEKPAAPTTWSSTTTGTVGEDVVLYWVHNTVDGSAQTYAELELTIDGTKKTHSITGSGHFIIGDSGSLRTDELFTDEDDKFNTNSCTVTTRKMKEGAKIKWRVRTAGITKKYGEWSTARTINIYATPTLELDLVDADGNSTSTYFSFPIRVKMTPGPDTQTPIGYHVSVISDQTYETVDRLGNEITISKGDVVYSKYFNSKKDLTVKLSANNIDLESNMNYTVECVVSMNSGLTAESKKTFIVYWDEDECSPNAKIGINYDNLSAVINPYCEYYTYVHHIVKYDNSTGYFVDTGKTIDDVYGEDVEFKSAIIDDAYTEAGDIVRLSIINDDDVFHYISEESTGKLLKGVTLSVYRREYDGRFVEIATGLKNNKWTYVTDLHPSLDYARYRIVATTTATGAVSYTDIPGVPVEESAVVIQWDETWSTFEVTEESELEQQPWAGSLLKLPYNIDISDSNKSDVSLINYVGRSHPVSYYGTQLGSSATWNVEIPKSDKDTLYGLRRLAIYMGDVYVREPSGSGYWANVSVSFSQKHCELTIPVTLSITRVEGGM